MLNEISQVVKDKDYDLTYKRSLINNINTQSRTTGMKICNRPKVTRGSGEGYNGGKKGKGLDKEDV